MTALIPVLGTQSAKKREEGEGRPVSRKRSEFFFDDETGFGISTGRRELRKMALQKKEG